MSNKHDANVRKNTLVNFQIGLIASLLFSFFMFEVYTAIPNDIVVDPPITIDDAPVEWSHDFKVYEEPKPKEVIAAKHTKPVVDPQEFKIAKDTDVLKDIDKIFKNVQPTESAPIRSSDIIDKEEEVEIVVPFDRIESAPIFPGCEKLSTNKERAACFSKKIARIVSRRFNTGLGQEYGLAGIQRIYTQFEVDASGAITNIQIRAPHPRLEREAKRVIDLFPEMTPGKQRGKPVPVKYQLPIVFQIQD
ncbi:energy transducer TonB [Aquimarina pacifica]|uniref:energy transducer TonB n=1 Tax=Aquimarina pacifica TaxID=1296415 RepID=UPI00055601F7|nr:energy transducer TonB [Aquimarina pacifica]